MSLVPKWIVAPYAVTVLPAASFAVTETLNPAPAVAVAGADRPRLVALASTVTATVVEREFAASETVIVCGPLVASVAENEPCPAFSVESGGSAAAASVLLKCTVPRYPAAAAPLESAAVTSMVKGTPAPTAAGAVATR